MKVKVKSSIILGILLISLTIFLGCSKETSSVSQEVTADMNYEAQTAKVRQQRIQQYEQVLKADPNNLQALIGLGNDYYDLDNNQKAVEYYSKAVEIDPNNPNVRTDLGTSYKRLGQLDNAIGQYNKSLEIDPNHATTYFNRGVVFYLKGETDQAVASWEKYLEFEPNGKLAMVARDHIERSKAADEQTEAAAPATH